MTSAQLSLFALQPAASEPPAAPAFAPTRELFSSPPGWGRRECAESRLEAIFRERSEEQWALVRQRLATADSASPSSPQEPAAANAEDELATGVPPAAPEAEDELTTFQPPPALALEPPSWKVEPLDAVAAGPYGRGVIYSVTPELGQAAVALEQGGVTVIALGVLTEAEETSELVELRGRVEALRRRLGLS